MLFKPGRSVNQRGKVGRKRRHRRAGYPAAALASVLVLGGANHASLAAVDSASLPQSGSAVGHDQRSSVPPVSPSSTGTLPVDAREPAGEVSAVKPDFGIPATVLDSYRRAAEMLTRSDPSCHVAWSVLAGIGKVESGHANGGDVDRDGNVLHPIFGPVLDGTNGTARIPDAFGSRQDHSSSWARAEGPMQFLPSTWEKWGTSARGDRGADPQNVYDASLTAAHYLCAGGRDLGTAGGLREAILSYNDSPQYLDIVSQWIRAYQMGGGPIPDEPGSFDPMNRAHGTQPEPPSYASSPPEPQSHNAAPLPSGRPPGPASPANGGGQHDPSSTPPPKTPFAGILPAPVNRLVPVPGADRQAPVPVLTHGLVAPLVSPPTPAPLDH